MFEKLKEYWLYIVLWLIALWALAYSYISTMNSKIWTEITQTNADALTMSIWRNDKYKINKTVANDLLQANWWKSIWKYKIDDNVVTYVIWENFDEILWKSKLIDISSNLSDIQTWELRTILVAQSKISIEWNESVKAVNLDSDSNIKIWDELIEHKDVVRLDNLLKWYTISWIWYWVFDDLNTAKDFRNSYFSTYEVFEIWDTWKYIVLQNLEIWWTSAVKTEVVSNTAPSTP